MKKIPKVLFVVVLCGIVVFALASAAIAETVVKRGDVDNNGEVNTIDYIYVKRSCFGTFVLDDVQKLCADCDRNGTVDAFDYLLIKRVYFGTYAMQNEDIVIDGKDKPEYEDDGYYNEVVKP